ncbi:MAG: RluA family pseudouridine synthase [Planctomycetales bacterium]|nr:RluA family pseudouridine synthase [Planctomycetales bacterium]
MNFTAGPEHTRPILAALRIWLPDHSWSALRKLLHARRIAINGVLCIDEGRRLTPGESVAILERALPPPPGLDTVAIRMVDPHFVVAEKPAGMISVRPPHERQWPYQRRKQQPTLDEIIPQRLALHAAKHSTKKTYRVRQRQPRLYAVHRIDRDTSGLLVFARTDFAQRDLIQQFAEHNTVRKYLALIPGTLPDQTVRSTLVRDRGDGLRGSGADDAPDGQHAVTHFTTLRQLGSLSELECRLETGRTNQIRIHLAELGHPICGDIKYRGPFDAAPLADESHCPRLALHAAQLRFAHPETGELLTFESSWPADIASFISALS